MFNRAYIEITNLCNFHCDFCPGTTRPPMAMRLSDFRTAAEELRPLTDYLYLHVMGEPLLHPDLDKVLAICRELGFKTCITTNGLLLPKGDGGDIHRGQQVAIKESVLPFKRFRTPVGKTVDILLGPEMRSTGEVMGFDRDFPHAFAKSQLAAYDGGLPTSGNVFISVNDTDKRQLPLMAVRLVELGFSIWATEGTASVLRRYGIDSKIVDKISTRVDSDPDAAVKVEHAVGGIGKNVVELIEEGKIDMILNTPNSRGSRSDGYSIRAAAIAADLPQFTTMTEFSAVLMAIEAVKHNDYQIMSIQEHAKQLFELESQE